MATIDTNSKSSLHMRCNSLPSAPHPLVSQFEEHLQRLKYSEATSSSSVSHNLRGLQDLHDCTYKLLLLPITQQAISRECSDRQVDELLDGSLRLLDICTAAKDCLQQSKESMQELQSVLRRRRGTETAFTIEAAKYWASRKMMKKAIQKALGNLKVMKKEFLVSSSNIVNETLSILKESEAMTMSSLESLLLFITNPKGQSKQSRWAVISKLMHPKRVACNFEEPNSNEFEKVDAALLSLISSKVSSIENIQSYMESLEMCIQDLEIGVECLSRQLIRTRVSLLNIFNH